MIRMLSCPGLTLHDPASSSMHAERHSCACHSSQPKPNCHQPRHGLLVPMCMRGCYAWCRKEHQKGEDVGCQRCCKRGKRHCSQLLCTQVPQNSCRKKGGKRHAQHNVSSRVSRSVSPLMLVAATTSLLLRHQTAGSKAQLLGIGHKHEIGTGQRTHHMGLTHAAASIPNMLGLHPNTSTSALSRG